MDEDEETIEDREDIEAGADGDDEEFQRVETDGEPEEEEAEPEPEEEPEPDAPASIYQPIVGETPEMAVLREKLADPDIASHLQAAIAAEVSRATASAMAGQSNLTALAAERPALWKAYGRDASAIMSQQSPEQRAKPENADAAMLLAALGPHMGKATYAAALKKYTALYNGEDAPAVEKKPKTPIPPSQRPPSPSSRGTGQSHQSRVQREMATRFGMSVRAISDLEEDLV